MTHLNIIYQKPESTLSEAALEAAKVPDEIKAQLQI